jgi:hypothetical protein
MPGFFGLLIIPLIGSDSLQSRIAKARGLLTDHQKAKERLSRAWRDVSYI